MHKFATVYKAAMRKIAEEPQQPSIDSYLHQLRRNLYDRGIYENLPGDTVADPRDLQLENYGERYHMKDTGPRNATFNRSFLPSLGLSGKSPWNNRQFMATMKQMNRKANPFKREDPNYIPAQKYIDARTKENRERMQNGTLIDNEDTNVPIPKELQGTPEGNWLERAGYGFANAGRNRASNIG